MGPMDYNETENKRADEATFTHTAPTPTAGGASAGGTDNKRAERSVKEVKAPRVATSGKHTTPDKVMSFSGEKV